ncbi:MAG: NAD(P)H-hydrate dehydratase [Planctomycetes bacterium]|nr:NAD(P)H-hydrate dehydratase [Planctomycetota bacterium]
MPTPAPPPTLVTDLPRLAPRAECTHKGETGRVAIIAGSRGMSGAACLAALGALRGGAGLVRVLAPASVQPIVASSEPCAMTVPLSEDERGRIASSATPTILESLAWADVVALGPGLGLSGEVTGVVSTVLTKFAGPVVLDADGLNSISGVRDWWKSRAGRVTVVTPHPGEMARLRQGAGLPETRGQSDAARREVAVEFARLTGVTVVLKGYATVVATPVVIYINTTGNPGMATGGMGDVLTGLVAALLGQGLAAFDAARLGVYCHGAAADRLEQQIGPRGYLAREVADAVPQALAQASRPPLGFK